MNPKNRFWTLNFWNRNARVPVPTPTRQRLTQAFSTLQGIQMMRDHLQEPRFGKAAEGRIVWRELVELELQDVDEQIERILHAAGGGRETLR